MKERQYVNDHSRASDVGQHDYKLRLRLRWRLVGRVFRYPPNQRTSVRYLGQVYYELGERSRRQQRSQHD